MINMEKYKEIEKEYWKEAEKIREIAKMKMCYAEMLTRIKSQMEIVDYYKKRLKEMLNCNKWDDEYIPTPAEEVLGL